MVKSTWVSMLCSDRNSPKKNCSTKWKCIFSERMEKMMMRNFATFFFSFFSLTLALCFHRLESIHCSRHSLHTMYFRVPFMCFSLSLSLSASMAHNAPSDVVYTQTHRLCAVRMERIFSQFSLLQQCVINVIVIDGVTTPSRDHVFTSRSRMQLNCVKVEN